MSGKEIERLLYNDCGLKGFSGISNAVRELLKTPESSTRKALCASGTGEDGRAGNLGTVLRQVYNSRASASLALAISFFLVASISG